MPRPECQRLISEVPATCFFKPQGIPTKELEAVELTVDELEAIRLADFQGLYHEQGALQMQISRQTFGRILTSAHRKVADFLVNGKLLQIQGGNVELRNAQDFECFSCKHKWGTQHSKRKVNCCPKCKSKKLVASTKIKLGK